MPSPRSNRSTSSPGWFDDGIIEGGKNKLVPSVSLKLRNKGSAPLRSVQINAIFKRVGEKEMWGEYFGWAVQREQPLQPGATTGPLVMRSTLGYTGIQPRMQMLQNKEFVDAKVEIFLKQGSKVLAKLAEFPIDRQLTHLGTALTWHLGTLGTAESRPYNPRRWRLPLRLPLNAALVLSMRRRSSFPTSSAAAFSLRRRKWPPWCRARCGFWPPGSPAAPWRLPGRWPTRNWRRFARARAASMSTSMRRTAASPRFSPGGRRSSPASPARWPPAPSWSPSISIASRPARRTRRRTSSSRCPMFPSASRRKRWSRSRRSGCWPRSTSAASGPAG